MSRWLCAALVAACATAVSAGVADASTWSGSTYWKVQRSSRVLSAGYTAHGDYWFHVGRRGAVRGHAVVAYEGNLDTDRINVFVSYMKSAAGVVLSGLPVIGPVANLIATNEIIGLRGSFDRPAEIRQGAISGSMHNGRLSLDWAGAGPKGLPFRMVLAELHHDKRLIHATIPVETPWRGSGHVTRGGATAVFQGDRRLPGGTLKRSGYWTARRIG